MRMVLVSNKDVMLGVKDKLEVAKGYIESGNKKKVSKAFGIISDCYLRCDNEHIKEQLLCIMNRYDSLLNGVGLYEGYLITVVTILSYCILYISVSIL